MAYQPLTRNSEFSRVYARGKAYVHPHVVLYVCKNRVRRTRVGLTATKKVGNAVRRNRARRVLRAALAQVLPAQAGGVDIVLVARAATPAQKSTRLAATLRKLCAKAGLPVLPEEGPAAGTPAAPGAPAAAPKEEGQ